MNAVCQLCACFATLPFGSDNMLISGCGIRAEVRNKRMSRSGFGFTLSYRGPLYEGRDITKGLVRIDVSLRGESVSEDRITVRTDYDDVKMFIISAASLNHIFAEKVRALLKKKIDGKG